MTPFWSRQMSNAYHALLKRNHETFVPRVQECSNPPSASPSTSSQAGSQTLSSAAPHTHTNPHKYAGFFSRENSYPPDQILQGSSHQPQAIPDSLHIRRPSSLQTSGSAASVRPDLHNDPEALAGQHPRKLPPR